MQPSSDLPLRSALPGADPRARKRSFRTARPSAPCRSPAAAPAGGCCRPSTSSPPRWRWPSSRSSAAPPSSPPCRSPRWCWSSSTACSASTARSPSGGALSGDDGVGWPVIRLVVAALFAWAASLMTHAQRRRAARPLGRLRRSSTPASARSSPPTCRASTRSRALGPGRRRGDRRAAPRLRAAERRSRPWSAPCRPPRTTTPSPAAASPPSRWSSATTPTASSSPASTPTTRACWSWSAPSSRSASRSACCPARSTCSRRRRRPRTGSAACR